jgi:hypothetical protein
MFILKALTFQLKKKEGQNQGKIRRFLQLPLILFIYFLIIKQIMM